MNKQRFSVLLSILAILVISLSATPVQARPNSAGAVYTMTNSATGNQVIRYNRSADGSLTWSGVFSTDGLGTGTGLGNQGGLVLSQNGSWLLVVNAGSNDISVFQVNHRSLRLTDKTDSNGVMPISITVNEDLVYVLNAGRAGSVGNIAGFHLSSDGRLSSIPGSVQPLSGVTAPAQISFNPTGTVLVVTEKSTSLIDTYKVNSHGIAQPLATHASNGATPFGFAFDPTGHLIVSEAGGGPQGTSAVSSYDVSGSGGLTTISPSVPDTQLAACWIVVTGNGRFAYTSNTRSNSISTYTINADGSISLLHSVGASTGTGPLDTAFSRNSRFLYEFNSGDHTIEGFRVSANGGLTLVGTVSGVPAGADGLAAN